MFKDSRFKIQYSRRGMTILLVILVMSALLAISIGIFNVVFMESQIAGEITESFRASYMAEQGLERTLFLDRSNGVQSPICTPLPPSNECTFTFNASTGGDYINSAGACFTAIILKRTSPASSCGPNNRFNCISSTGAYNCSVTAKTKRNASFNY